MRHTSLKLQQWVAGTVVLLALASAVPAQAGYADAVMNNGNLVSYWNLNEQSGSTAADQVTGDAVDGANQGTYSGPGVTLGNAGPGSADGLQGFSATNRAPAFSGTTTQMLAMNPAGYGGLTDLTMSTWFRFDPSTSTNHIGGLEDTSGNRYVFGNHQYGSGLSSFAKRPGSQISCSGYSVTDSQWHHLAVTYAGGTTLKMYVDGKLKGTNTNATVLGLDAADALAFSRDVGDANRNLNGQVDEIAFFDRGLSAAEVDNQYAAGASAYVAKVNELAPAHYWRFSETAGTTAGDAVGDKDGTYSDPGPTLGQPGPRPGDALSGMPDANLAPDFNRSQNDSVSISGDYPDAGAITMSLWTQLAPDGSDTNRQIIAGYQDSVGTRYNFLVCRESNGYLKFYLSDTDGDQIIVQPYADFTDSRWHNIVFSWDGSELKTYLDGGGEQTFTDASVSGDLIASDFLFVGKDIVNANQLDGLVDELILFDYVLTPQQVGNLYSAAIPEPDALLLLCIGLVGLLVLRRRRKK